MWSCYIASTLHRKLQPMVAYPPRPATETTDALPQRVADWPGLMSISVTTCPRRSNSDALMGTEPVFSIVAHNPKSSAALRTAVPPTIGPPPGLHENVPGPPIVLSLLRMMPQHAGCVSVGGGGGCCAMSL